jgi:hypothetical protein
VEAGTASGCTAPLAPRLHSVAAADDGRGIHPFTRPFNGSGNQAFNQAFVTARSRRSGTGPDLQQ